MDTELNNCLEDISIISDIILEHKIDISQQLLDIQKDKKRFRLQDKIKQNYTVHKEK